MFSRITGYLLLYTLSFGFFTAAFHTFAFAGFNEQSPRKIQKQSVPTVSLKPTPTIYFAPTAGTASGISNKDLIPSKNSVLLPTALSTTPNVITTLIKPTYTPIIILPTNTPIPTLTTAPTVTLTPAKTGEQQNTSGGMSAEKLFEMSNTHRQSLGLSVLQKDDKTCALARERAGEIQAELSNGTLHSGMYGRNLPYWNTENAIAMGPEEAAFAWWLSDYIHRKAIENPSYTTSCTACSGVYCVQEFTSYQPK